MSYEEQHAILCEAELAAEQADAREARTTALRVVSR